MVSKNVPYFAMQLNAMAGGVVVGVVETELVGVEVPVVVTVDVRLVVGVVTSHSRKLPSLQASATLFNVLAIAAQLERP
jgi:hypothetical protein